MTDGLFLLSAVDWNAKDPFLAVFPETQPGTARKTYHRSNTAPELLILVLSKLPLKQKRKRQENKLTSHSSRCHALSAFQVFSPEGELKHECFQKMVIYIYIYIYILTP